MLLLDEVAEAEAEVALPALEDVPDAELAAFEVVAAALAVEPADPEEAVDVAESDPLTTTSVGQHYISRM